MHRRLGLQSQLPALTPPFTALVAASRVLLGLHYPSDVLMSGLLGGAIAGLSLPVPL
jgi:undecaprenyl-diphosphatase